MGFFEKYKNRLPKQKTKEELDEHFDGLETEKGDKLAMFIAAFVTLVLPILAIIGVIYGILWLMFT